MHVQDRPADPSMTSQSTTLIHAMDVIDCIDLPITTGTTTISAPRPKTIPSGNKRTTSMGGPVSKQVQVCSSVASAHGFRHAQINRLVHHCTERTVTLGELSSVLNQSRPHYYWDRSSVICSAPTDSHPCCPAYCCNVVNTAHGLQHPVDMSFRKTQTVSLNGTFQVLSWATGEESAGAGLGAGAEEGRGGIFVGAMYRTFDKPIQGGACVRACVRACVGGQAGVDMIVLVWFGCFSPWFIPPSSRLDARGVFLQARVRPPLVQRAHRGHGGGRAGLVPAAGAMEHGWWID